MGIKHIVTGTAAVAIVILAHVAPVSALSVKTNAGVGATVGASTSAAHVNLNAYANASSSATTSNGLGERVSTIVHTIVGSRASTTASTTRGVGQEVRAAVLPIVLTRADVQSQGAAGGTASLAPSSVHTDEELSSFIAAKIQHDPNLDQVQAATDTVAVTYKVGAKLLGFIPMRVDATTAVSADGTVTVSYPWWSFLLAFDHDVHAVIAPQVTRTLGMATTATTTGNAMQSENASATGTAQAQANSQANMNASMQAQFNAQQRAELIDAITAALQAAFGANASATVNTQ